LWRVIIQGSIENKSITTTFVIKKEPQQITLHQSQVGKKWMPRMCHHDDLCNLQHNKTNTYNCSNYKKAKSTSHFNTITSKLSNFNFQNEPNSNLKEYAKNHWWMGSVTNFNTWVFGNLKTCATNSLGTHMSTMSTTSWI
jgi:hypothetical protein